MSDGCSHAAWEMIGNANRCAEPGCRAWLTDTNGRTSTPAPAWEWSKPGDTDPGEHVTSVEIGPFVVQAYSYDGQWRGESYATFGGKAFARVGPYPTAPEAARAAVEALRAIVEPVVEALDRVPELETP